MITVRSKGDFSVVERYFERAKNILRHGVLEKYGAKGVEILKANTPRDTGKTAESWSYEISQNDGKYVVSWNNSNVNKGVNIAILIQYGHGTGWGGYVRGIDYINPSLKPIFENLAEDAWKEVTSL